MIFVDTISGFLVFGDFELYEGFVEFIVIFRDFSVRDKGCYSFL